MNKESATIIVGMMPCYIAPAALKIKPALATEYRFYYKGMVHLYLHRYAPFN